MKYSEEDIKLALLAITQNKECVTEAAQKYNIPIEILENNLLDLKKQQLTDQTILDIHRDGSNPFATEEMDMNSDALKVILNNRPRISLEQNAEHVDNDNILQNGDNLVFGGILNKDQEYELMKITVELHTHFCGISELDVRRIIFEYMEINGIKHDFNDENRLISDKLCSQFIESYGQLNNLFRQTNINSGIEFSNETSNLNHLVIDKFLHEYKKKSSLFEPNNKETELKNFDDVCQNEFNVDDFEFDLPSLVKSHETKEPNLRLENSNHLNQVEENHKLKEPLVFHNSEEANFNVGPYDSVNSNHEQSSEINSNNMCETKVGNSESGNCNAENNSAILPETEMKLNYGKIEENSKFLIENCSANIFSMPGQGYDGNLEKYATLTLEDTIDSNYDEEILKPLTVEKNKNLTSEVQFIGNSVEKHFGVRPEQLSELNEGNLDSTIENSITTMKYYHSSVTEPFPNLELSSNLNALNFVEEHDQMITPFQARGSSETFIQTNLLIQNETKTAHEIPEFVSNVPVQNEDNSNIFGNSTNQIGDQSLFKIGSIDQTGAEIINTALTYNSSSTELEKNNCSENMDYSTPANECGSISSDVNFDPGHCEFDSLNTKLPANEFENTDRDESCAGKIGENAVEMIRDSQNITTVDSSDSNVHNNSVNPSSLPVHLGESHDSEISHPISTQKITESDTSVEKKSHTVRKKKKSKTKSSKHVGPKSSKPKKSKYLYKLKSFNGSVLYFTSSTSVSFIKPKITLTKLDEKEYVKPSVDDNSAEKEPQSDNSSPVPAEPALLDSVNLDDNCKNDDSPPKEIPSEIHSSTEIFSGISPPMETLSEISPSEEISLPIASSNETPSEISTPKETPAEISPAMETLSEISPSKKTLSEISPLKEISLSISSPKETLPVTSSLKKIPSSKEIKRKKIDTTEEENLTPTFSMQTRKKRLKFLPDGTLVTPKQELEDKILSSSSTSRSAKKRPLKTTPQSADKRIKLEPDDNAKSSTPAEANEIKRKPKSRQPPEPKYIPKYNGVSKKPQKIFDYDSYYREKSNVEKPNEPKKLLLPVSCRKQTVSLNRIKSISESAKSGQLVVNPAQLLSCLLGTPINEDQICTIRFKPSAEERTLNNRINVTPSKLASDNHAIKPVAKRQLELLQNNNAFNIFPNNEGNPKLSKNSKKKITDDEKSIAKKS